MTDTNDTTGGRVDAAIEAARRAADDLRQKLASTAAGVADEVSAAVDAVSAKIDEIQAAWAERDQQ